MPSIYVHGTINIMYVLLRLLVLFVITANFFLNDVRFSTGLVVLFLDLVFLVVIISVSVADAP